MDTSLKAKDGTSLDPSVVALVKAIKQHESGGDYNITGKSNEYGAYQYTEPTWKDNAAKYLGNANADVRDPVNQDKAAYYAVLDDKNNGLTPEQIASKWNSGNPDAYKTGNVGTNQYGAHYDTGAYVNSVMGYYKNYKNDYLAQHPNIAEAATTGAQPQMNQADQASATQYGALLPSKEGEGPIAAGFKAAVNLPTSYLHLGSGAITPLTHPIKTAEGVFNLIAGGTEKAANKVFGTKSASSPQEQTFDAFTQGLKDRYGSLENLQRSATNDPAGFGLDVLTALQLGASGADLLSNARHAPTDIAEHVATGRQILSDPEIGADVPSVIQDTQKNIVQGLAHENINRASQAIAKLDPSQFNSLEDFAKAAQDAAKGTTYSGMLNRGVSAVAQTALAPVKAVGRGLKSVASGILGGTTNEGYSTVKTALNSAMQGGDARQAFKEALRGDYSPEEIVNEAQDGLDNMYANRRANYQQQLAEIAGSDKTYDISPVIKNMDNALGDFKIQKVIDPDTGTIDLDFSRSKFALDPTSQGDIQRVYNYVNNYGTKAGDRTAVGLDNLKQVVGGYYSPNSDYRAFVQATKSGVDDVLKDVPGYTKMSSDYADASDQIKNLKQSLSLGGRAGVETTFKKLIGGLKGNNAARQAFVDELNRQAGGGLLPKLAGSDMSQFAPGGLTGALEKTGGVYALLNGTGLSTLLPLITIASPRIVGEFINALGLTAGAATKVFSGLGIPNAAVFVGNALNKVPTSSP